MCGWFDAALVDASLQPGKQQFEAGMGVGVWVMVEWVVVEWVVKDLGGFVVVGG